MGVASPCAPIGVAIMAAGLAAAPSGWRAPRPGSPRCRPAPRLPLPRGRGRGGGNRRLRRHLDGRLLLRPEEEPPEQRGNRQSAEDPPQPVSIRLPRWWRSGWSRRRWWRGRANIRTRLRGSRNGSRNGSRGGKGSCGGSGSRGRGGGRPHARGAEPGVTSRCLIGEADFRGGAIVVCLPRTVEDPGRQVAFYRVTGRTVSAPARRAPRPPGSTRPTRCRQYLRSTDRHRDRSNPGWHQTNPRHREPTRQSPGSGTRSETAEVH